MALTAVAVSLSLCLLLVATNAQRPTLNLFQDGSNSTRFLVPVDTPEFFDLQLVINPNLNELVTDPQGEVEGITVVIMGESGSIIVDRSQLRQNLSLTSSVQDQEYQYQLVGEALTLADYSTLLSTLVYRSNLTAESQVFDISITAFDEIGNGPSLVASIRLLEANQQAPEFSQAGVYEIAIDENSRSNGEIVITITASDENGVSYSLNTTSTVFSIDQATGDITVIDSSALNYEIVENRLFQLEVVATDLYSIQELQRSTQANVEITINNINDISPAFVGTPYVFSVLEETAGAIVGQLVAEDGDEGALLIFNFLQSSTGSLFSLNGGTGLITVRTGLDFEDEEIHSFDVVVSDGLNTVSTSVTVNVIDIADNRPVISPAEKRILLNLDIGNNIVHIGLNGTGGPLTVTDDSPILSRGVARINVLKSGVSYIIYLGVCFVKYVQ